MNLHYCQSFHKTNHLHLKALKYGTILKREVLVNASFQNLTEHLVLESDDPFPGYYCSEKHPADISCKEKSYYLPVQSLSCCHDDDVCRVSLEVLNVLNVQACPSQITLMGKYVRAIRVKGLGDKSLTRVTEIFTNNGIHFFSNRKVPVYLCYIYLKAFFEVIKIDTGIFQNQLSPEIYYLIIPEKMEWKLFEKLITYQKSQSIFKNYDAAIGYWMEKPAFTDFLRIYGKSLTIKQLDEIKNTFSDNLSLFNQNKLIF